MTVPSKHPTNRWSRIVNVVGYLLYAGLLAVGGYAVWFSLFLGMATDGCHDAACDASYHVRPAMLTMWIGVGAVLVSTLAVMVARSSRGKIVVGWPLAGLAALGLVFVIATQLVLH